MAKCSKAGGGRGASGGAKTETEREGLAHLRHPAHGIANDVLGGVPHCMADETILEFSIDANKWYLGCAVSAEGQAGCQSGSAGNDFSA